MKFNHSKVFHDKHKRWAAFKIAMSAGCSSAMVERKYNEHGVALNQRTCMADWFNDQDLPARHQALSIGTEPLTFGWRPIDHKN